MSVRITRAASDWESIPLSELKAIAPLILEHLNLLLQDAGFRSSRRSQEFLRHVVPIALAGEIDRLKERILGIELFHRSSDYNTSEDAIVRVSANDVRRRLTQFYAEHPDQDLQILLLSGSYIPEFRRHPAEEAPLQQAGPQLGAAPPQPAPLPESQPEASIESLQPLHPKPVQSHAPTRQMAPALLACMAALLLLSFAAGWLLSRGSEGAAGGLHRHDFSFYKELLGPLVTDTHMSTDIVLSNPKLFLFRGGDTPAPDDGLNPHFLLTPEMSLQLGSGANDNQESYPYHRLVLDDTNYTGMGEAKALFGLGAVLSAVNRPAHLSETRFLNWDVAESKHLIVLGAPHMSHWTEKALAGANFVMDHDQIRNLHPLAGEQSSYANHGNASDWDDYALLWMSQSPTGARIFLIAGITSASTAGAGNFFADPASMHPIYNRLKSMAGRNSFPANWQVLLHVVIRDRVPVRIEPVACRIN